MAPHDTTDHRLPVDWAKIAEAAARELLGEPNPTLSTNQELRWHQHGSFRLHLASGRWQNFEVPGRGGAIDLVQHVAGLDRAAALSWLRDRGHLPQQRTVGMNGQRPTFYPKKGAASATKARSERSVPTASSESEDRRSREISYIQHVWSDQTLPIPIDPAHPARRWLQDRHLWRDRFPLPHSIRWLPAAEAPHFRGLHQGAGALIACMAPASEWESAWPNIPAPQAIHLINVGADGSPSLDRPADHIDWQGNSSPGRGKRFRGPHQGAVLLVGNPALSGADVLIAEGVADILALTCRFDGVGVAPITTPRKLALDKPFVAWVVAAHEVIIHADADSSSTGQIAAGSLRQTIIDAGGRARAMPPPEGHGKDAADIAKQHPFPPLHDAWESYAQTLRVMYPSWPRWDIARLADIATGDP